MTRKPTLVARRNPADGLVLEADGGPDRPDRRRFMGQLGAAAAVASSGLAGCVRKPVEHIVPHAQRPEDLVPGRPLYFATAAHIGDAVWGLLGESQDGRPIKLEGNPKHPMSRGAAGAWAQASVLDLYDGDRSLAPTREGVEVTRDEAVTALEAVAERLEESEGARLGLVIGRQPSPTFARLLAAVRQRLPKARLYIHDPAWSGAAAEGLRLAGARPSRVDLRLDKARVIVALDSDLLGHEGDAVRHARDFAAGRRLDGDLNRLYVAEPNFSTTGGMADHRLRVAGGRVAELVAHLGAKLGVAGCPKPVGADDAMARWAAAAAKDLKAHRGASLIVAGGRQPAAVHGAVALLNDALGNTGATVAYVADEEWVDARSISDLASDLLGGAIDQLIMVGGNPAYDAPAHLGLATLIGQAPLSVHLAASRDETSKISTWHIPRSHYLESWNDLRSSDGTVALAQPLIGALRASLSDLELLAILAGAEERTGYELVRATWRGRLQTAAGQAGGAFDDAAFETAWRRWVHDGLVEGSRPAPAGVSLSWAKVGASWPGAAAPKSDALEVDFVVDSAAVDGRLANNAWLQEFPDPVTKLTWDNAAMVSPATAKALGLRDEGMATLSIGGRRLKVAVLVARGVAENVVVLPLGYGRRTGSVAKGRGFDAYAVQPANTPWIAQGATLSPTTGTYKLARTQDHDRDEGRPLVRQATVSEYRQRPDYVNDGEVLPAEKIKSLWEEPALEGRQQWGMAIDLNTCTGCGACTIACQAENNIPVVGKDEVLNGREMHWIRIDRYFQGSEDDPTAVVQPVACAHCETAPCENVCPVAATAHSPEGLNDMAYNRCIGTRYCANNCPYKVRRFNFLAYQKETEALVGPMMALQRNPDVSVRFRGVMEKCTYCVQRINGARSEAKRKGDGIISDGRLQTACQQTCPAGAITFGDVSDPESAVSKAKAEKRNYALLSELNIRPRTTYLGRIRNPNPDLAES